MSKTDNRTAARRMASLKDAVENHGGTFWGGIPTSRVTIPTGRLPKEYSDVLQDESFKGTLEYVVYSYATPIGWYANGEWTIPDVKYSNTTSRHQGRLGVAIRDLESSQSPES